jgi:hypothetical protein
MAAQPGSREFLASADSAGANPMPSVIPPDGPVQFVQSPTDGRRPSRQHDRDSYSVTALADITDRALHAATPRLIWIGPLTLPTRRASAFCF